MPKILVDKDGVSHPVPSKNTLAQTKDDSDDSSDDSSLDDDSDSNGDDSDDSCEGDDCKDKDNIQLAQADSHGKHKSKHDHDSKHKSK